MRLGAVKYLRRNFTNCLGFFNLTYEGCFLLYCSMEWNLILRYGLLWFIRPYQARNSFQNLDRLGFDMCSIYKNVTWFVFCWRFHRDGWRKKVLQAVSFWKWNSENWCSIAKVENLISHMFDIDTREVSNKLSCSANRILR